MGAAISRTALSAVAICGSALWAVAGYLFSEGEGKQTANPGIRYYKNGSVCDAYEAPFCERKSTKFVCFFLLLVKVDRVSFFSSWDIIHSDSIKTCIFIYSLVA